MLMKSIKLDCPVCQTAHQKDLPIYIHAQKDQHLVRDLLTNQLYHFECTHCGAKRQLEVPMIFHNEKQQTIVINLANASTNKEIPSSILEYVPDQTLLSDYHLRLVMTIPELIEKLQILAINNLSDGMVELVKLLTDGLIVNEKPDTTFLQRFFIVKANEPKIIYIADEGEFFVDYDQKLQDFISSKFQRQIDAIPKGEFIMVNKEWAHSVLEEK